MVERWWCVRGESVWKSVKWEAYYLWDDGALWGLSIVRAGSTDRRETNHWDHSSQSLSGTVHSSFTAEERAELTQALIAASPKQRATMSSVEKAVIDATARALSKPDPAVSGRYLRSTLERLTPAAVDAACRALCPRYLRRIERVAGDAFELTFAGLCESSDANAELTVVTATLNELAKRYAADPDVEEFRWAQVRDSSGMHGDAAMIFACNVWRSLGWDATARLDGAEYFFPVPKSIEQIRQCRNAQDYISWLRTQDEFPSSTTPARGLKSSMADVVPAIAISEAGGSLMLPRQPTAPGVSTSENKWNGWRSKGVLGAGGQGEAHLVERDLPSGAVEYGVLKSLHQNGEQQRRRFANELEALSKVRHSGILKVVEKPDGESFFVSEYCEGHDVASRGTGDWSLLERIRFFRDVVDAVGAAHAAGIIHRDLKPANILLRKDRRTPVIADFGICFLEGKDGGRVTMTPEVAGSRSYRAPELERGRLDRVLPSCDSYSLGKVLYWLLSERELPREYHREPEYDLTDGGTNRAMNLVYELLDQLVVEKAGERLENAHVIATETNKLIDKLEHGAHVLRRGVRQHCIFCFDGEYVVTAIEDLTEEQARQHVGQLQMTINYKRPWMTMLCDRCGHLQLFRPDLSTNSSWR